MDSLNQSNKKLPSLRTYAKDLEHARKEKNLPPATHVEATTAKTPEKILPRKKEPLINATPVPKPKPLTAKENTKSTPALKPIPAKKPLPKVPTFSASNNTTFIVDNDDAAAATIITDTKHDRFKLLPSLFASITKWFADQKKARAVKNTPKYTVPETTLRKGVIQKATGATGKSATADFASIQERIKQRKDLVKKGKPHTTWSANTEPAFLLLEASTPEPVINVQVVSRKSFRAVPLAPAPKAVPVAIPEPIVATPIVTTPVEIPVVVTPTPVEIPIVVAPTPAEIVVDVPEEIISEPLIEEPPMKADSTEDTSTKYTFLSLNTNLLALSISGIALVLVILGTFGHILLNKNSDSVTSVVILPTALLPTSSFVSMQDNPPTHTTLISKIAAAQLEGGVISEFVFTDDSGAAVSPSEIITALAVSAEQNLTQSIKTIRFGYVSNTDPYILIEVTSDIVARGGLLAWEDTLYADFTAIFSKKADKLGNRIKFIDGTFGGSDVRILKNETGGEIVMYGILDKMILITTNSRTFSEIANLIQ